jgi:hypothetical protein
MNLTEPADIRATTGHTDPYPFYARLLASPRRPPGRRNGARRARARRMALKIGRQMFGFCQSRRTLGHLWEVEKDRQQVDVGERELIADEMAGHGHRFVQDLELTAHRGRTASIACRSGLPSAVPGTA